jgi:ComF family protein
MSLAAALLDLVLAPSCLGCDGRIAAGDAARLVCRRCRTRLHPLPPPCCARCGAPLLQTGRRSGFGCDDCRSWPLALVSARSACLLAPPADRLVHQLKYRGWLALAPVLAARMSACAPPLPGHEPAFCTPVPTSSGRVRKRGYNQAALLARALAAGTGRSYLEALVRVRANGSQTTLQPVARRANVAGAFTAAASHADRVPGAHVVLVDDVLTTGATAAECTRALAAAGACCIRLVTFARALDARRLINI